MRWFKTKDLRSSLYAMLSVSTARPGSMTRHHGPDPGGHAGRGGEEGGDGQRLARRIRYATDLQALWFMRGEVMQLLARTRGRRPPGRKSTS
jgi:hypothetical protein